MATKIEIQSEQHLNNAGNLGAVLFLGGPIVSGIAYSNTVTALIDNRTEISGYSSLLYLGGLCFLFGCILLLVGRTYHHQVVVHPVQAPAKKGETAEWQ